MVLEALVGPWPLFQFLFLFYTAGRTPWRGDQPVTRPIPTHRTTQTQNKLTCKHQCLKWDSNPRSQCLSGQRQFMSYIPRSHSDRQTEISVSDLDQCCISAEINIRVPVGRRVMLWSSIIHKETSWASDLTLLDGDRYIDHERELFFQLSHNNNYCFVTLTTL
jgi:hypothetical protein